MERRDMSKISNNLWLGGATAARDTNYLKSIPMTHILTLDLVPLSRVHKDPFQYKYIEIRDAMDSDLLSHFAACFDFIEDAHVKNGAVLVHCVVGVSRSATIVIAYTMWKKKISLNEAIELIRSKRSIICPNSNFRNQLKIFEEMGCVIDPSFPIYRRYRLFHVAQRCKEADSLNLALAKETLSADPTSTKNSLLGECSFKCRKCRRLLFRESSLLPHPDGGGGEEVLRDEALLGVGPTFEGEDDLPSKDVTCSRGQIFVEPLEWMRIEIDHLEGKLACPKCQCKLGSFTWVGEPCVCGQWVCPAFRIGSQRIDKCLPPGTISNAQTALNELKIGAAATEDNSKISQ